MGIAEFDIALFVLNRGAMLQEIRLSFQERSRPRLKTHRHVSLNGMVRENHFLRHDISRV